MTGLYNWFDEFLEQCYRPDNWVYSGEILLGMKFSETGAAESLKKREDIAVDCGLMGGQLQVH